MAESSLSLNRLDIERYVARDRGWNPDRSGWGPTEQADMDLVMDRGVRWFYQPPPLPSEQHNHTWSFLKPEYRFTTVANQSDYDLPDDFGGLEGTFQYQRGDAAWTDIRLTSEHRIRTLRQGTTDTVGYPELASIMPLPSDGDEPQRFSLLLWPKAGGEYPLAMTYLSNPNAITGQ